VSTDLRVKVPRHVAADIVARAAGMGSTVAITKALLRDDKVASDLLDQALQGKQGRRSDLVSNSNEVARPVGTTRDQALRRLRKDAPELHAQVLAGELSPHAAMVEAGFRP